MTIVKLALTRRKPVITATFEVVTPMFLGGATDENGKIRCADTISFDSVKGALRETFRSLYWARYRAGFHAEPVAKADAHVLRVMRLREAKIFGSQNQEGKDVGRFPFDFTYDVNGCTHSGELKTSNGLIYSLGRGLFSKRLTRSFIKPGATFTIELMPTHKVSSDDIDLMADTLKLFGLTGGLGSRRGKGFGSVSITSLTYKDDHFAPPTSCDEYSQALIKLLGNFMSTSQPLFTAFSQKTRIQISASGTSSLELLDKHGTELGLYRSNGRSNHGDRLVYGQTKEKKDCFFWDDHDWAYQYVGPKPTKADLPRRVVFGLPHNYDLSGAKKKLSIDLEGGRRASPLKVHVHKLSENSYTLVHFLMDAKFLPDESRVVINRDARRSIKGSEVNDLVDDFKDIHKFLDSTVFPDKKKINLTRAIYD